MTLRRIAGCYRHEKIRNAVPRGREKTSGTGAAPERGRKLHRDRHESQTTATAQIAREREWKQPQARASSSCCYRRQGSGLVRTARTHTEILNCCLQHHVLQRTESTSLTLLLLLLLSVCLRFCCRAGATDLQYNLQVQVADMSYYLHKVPRNAIERSSRFCKKSRTCLYCNLVLFSFQ